MRALRRTGRLRTRRLLATGTAVTVAFARASTLTIAPTSTLTATAAFTTIFEVFGTATDIHGAFGEAW